MLWRECDFNRPVEYTETWTDSTGSYGESQIYYEPSTTTGNLPTSTSCKTKSHCWHMLPCGICRLTNLPCHYGGYEEWEITC